MFQNTRYILRLTLLILLTALFSTVVIVAQDDSEEEEEGDHAIHWSYAGEEGPDHWGAMTPDFTQCLEGTAQSPIDVTGAVALNLTDIGFDYMDTALHIFNNGHTIQVNADEGSAITYNEITYNLLQFHFHHPSEHTVNGEAAPMEIHFVHQDPNSGNLAVVGVMLTESDADNEAYAAIFDHLPAEISEATASDLVISLDALLPEDRTYFTYQGSLTTPPCSEIVRWLLLENPVELSAEQIAAFGEIFEANARPVQPLNNRDLFIDSNE